MSHSQASRALNVRLGSSACRTVPSRSSCICRLLLLLIPCLVLFTLLPFTFPLIIPPTQVKQTQTQTHQHLPAKRSLHEGRSSSLVPALLLTYLVYCICISSIKVFALTVSCVCAPAAVVCFSGWLCIADRLCIYCIYCIWWFDHLVLGSPTNPYMSFRIEELFVCCHPAISCFHKRSVEVCLLMLGRREITARPLV